MLETQPRILIVDDDVAITQQLFWTLCDDYEVMTAHDLSSAIRRATIYEPEVAIIDLHLPPTLDSTDTGMRIIQFIKSHLPHSKVIVTTAETDAGVKAECMAQGADGFFSKPLDVESLRQEIMRLSLARRYPSDDAQAHS